MLQRVGEAVLKNTNQTVKEESGRKTICKGGPMLKIGFDGIFNTSSLYTWVGTNSETNEKNK